MKCKGGKTARAPVQARKAGKKKGAALEPDMYDEIDQFHSKRDKVGLDIGDSGSEEESDSDEEEGIMDLPDSDEESGEGEEEEEDEDSDDGDGRKRRDEDELDDKAWGKKKSAYYSTDYIDEDLGSDFGRSDSEAEEEEKEALRMQKAYAEQYEEDDFGAGDLVPKAAAGKEGGKKKKRAQDSVVEAVTNELDSIRLGREAEMMSVAKDMSKLSETEKLEMLMKDSPELLELLGDFKENMALLRSHFQPVVAAHGEEIGRDQSDRHADYVDVKYHLLLSYCANISFYLLLKARGRIVKDHPVIDQLVKLREMLEALRPVDAKVKTQMATLADRAAAAADEPEAKEIAKKSRASATGKVAAKKSKKAPIHPADSEEEESAGEEMEEEDFGEEEEEEEEDDDYLDLPSAKTGFSAKPKKAAFEGVEFQPGQASKKKVAAGKSKASKDALADFGESAVGAEFSIKKKGAKGKTALEKAAVAAQRTKGKVMRSADEDVPRKQQARDSAGRNAVAFEDDSDGYDDLPGQKHALDRHGSDGGEDGIDEDDYYEAVRSARKKRKQDRDELFERKADYLPEEEAEEKRGVNWQIQKNKGLTPHRSKAVKNPRVKHKLKFQKAVTKRKHQVREYKSGASGGSYGGETSGLKKNLARSVKL